MLAARRCLCCRRLSGTLAAACRDRIGNFPAFLTAAQALGLWAGTLVHLEVGLRQGHHLWQHIRDDQVLAVHAQGRAGAKL